MVSLGAVGLPLLRSTFLEGLAAFSPLDLLDIMPTLTWMNADFGVYTGGARQFYTADKGYLTIADNAALSTGDIDFTIAGWVYFDAVSTGEAQEFVTKRSTSTSANLEYLVRIDSSNKFGVLVGDGVGGFDELVSTFTAAAGTWYFVVASHTSATSTLTISVNNATPQTDTSTSNPADTAFAFNLGGTADLGRYVGGRQAKFAFWKRTLTTAEKTYLYNLGNGRVYGELGEAGTDGSNLLTNLISYWNLNETSGTANAIDAHGTNDLTPTFAELISNGGFETAGGGGADVFGSWIEVTSGTGTITDELVVVDAGAHAAKLTGLDGSNYSQVYQTVMTVGHRYTFSVRSRYDISGKASLYHGGTIRTDLTLTGAYATYSVTKTCAGDGRAYLEVLTDGLTAYFDTVSVKAVDIPVADGPESEIAADSVGSNHGVLTNFADPDTAWSSDQPTPIAALVDGSLAFDGTNDRVQVADNSVFDFGTGAFSISFWMKTTSTTLERFVIDNTANNFGTGGFLLDFRADQAAKSITFYCTSGGSSDVITGGTALNTGAWFHVVALRNGTNLKLYVNGVSDATPTTDNALNVTNTKVVTFGDAVGGLLAFSGNLADIRFYNVALSDANITALYAGTDYRTGIVAQYKLDDGPQTGLVTGDALIKWRSYEGNAKEFLQATPEKRPVYNATGINGLPTVQFDGINDLLVAASAFLTGTSGCVMVVYRLDAVPNAYQMLFGSFDEVSDTRLMGFYGRGNSANNHIGYTQGNADTADLLDGSTEISVDTDYIVVFQSNSSIITARLNGTIQTLNADTGANNGDWWDDTTAKDNVTIGAYKILSGEGQFLKGKVRHILILPAVPTAQQLAQLEQYFADEAAIVLP